MSSQPFGWKGDGFGGFEPPQRRCARFATSRFEKCSMRGLVLIEVNS